jgi:hypothetical protein
MAIKAFSKSAVYAEENGRVRDINKNRKDLSMK